MNWIRLKRKLAFGFVTAAMLLIVAGMAFGQTGGALKVSSFPSGANVTVDGVDTRKLTPMSLSLPLGDHTVTVALGDAGWNPDTRTVTIVNGNNDLSVTLLPKLTVGAVGPRGERGDPGPDGIGISVKGDPGVAAIVSVGTTTAAPPGTPAAVSNSGNSQNAILNFVIPQGLPGVAGNSGADSTVPGPQGIPGLSIVGAKGDPGQSIIGPQGIPGLSIVGPKGDKGDSIVGPQGIPGLSIVGPKGDKGDSIVGPVGQQGSPGLSIVGPAGYTPQKGLDYFDGAVGAASTVPGPAGYTPRKGIDYFDGAASTVAGPQGLKGDTGAASTVPGPIGLTGSVGLSATVAIGTTNTGASGTAASVTDTGTPSGAILNFTIPAGVTGSMGPQGFNGGVGPQGDPWPAPTSGFIGTGSDFSTTSTAYVADGGPSITFTTSATGKTMIIVSGRETLSAATNGACYLSFLASDGGGTITINPNDNSAYSVGQLGSASAQTVGTGSFVWFGTLSPSASYTAAMRYRASNANNGCTFSNRRIDAIPFP